MSSPDLIFSKGPALAGERAWAYALGAVYHVAHGFAVNAVLPEPQDGMHRDMLARDWGVNGRAELVECLNDLGAHGHRHRHGTQLRYYALLWRPAIASMREEYRASIREDGSDASEASKNLWRLDAVQSDRGGIRASPLLAFDAARAIMLARAGLMLGWLAEPEAWAYMLDVARNAQRTYRSWAAYGTDFILARDVWAGRRCGDIFDDVVTQLLSDPDSPWLQLAWEQPGLSVPRALHPAVLPDDAPVWTLELL